MFPLQLFGSVGPDQENSIEDVSRVASALSEIGDSDVHQAAHTGQWDDTFDRSVKAFQDEHGLDVDGVLAPRGPTEGAINERLRTQHAAEHRSGRAGRALAG